MSQPTRYPHPLALAALVGATTSLSCTSERRHLDDLVGSWSAEFSPGIPPARTGQERRGSIVFGTIVFDSVVTTPSGDLHLVGRYQLDSTSTQPDADPVVALLGHPDPCFHPAGELGAYIAQDDAPGVNVEISFTRVTDCGLVGRVSLATRIGRWHQPAFSDPRAEGELRIARRT